MRIILIAACALSALTAGCGEGDGVRISTSRRSDGEARGPLKVIEALQCPQAVGPLTRKGTAQDGGTLCLYSGPRGAEVRLHLAALGDRTPESVLAGYEQTLKQGLAWAADVAEAPRTVAIDAEGDRADIAAPGVRIQAEGENAHIRIGPISIRSSRKDGDAAPSSASASSAASGAATEGGDSVSVRAGSGGSEVRVREGGEGVRAVWRLSGGDSSPTGWRTVGYTARGPSGGPLAVATVRSRDAENDALFDAVDELIRLNVGD